MVEQQRIQAITKYGITIGQLSKQPNIGGNEFEDWFANVVDESVKIGQANGKIKGVISVGGVSTNFGSYQVDYLKDVVDETLRATAIAAYKGAKTALQTASVEEDSKNKTHSSVQGKIDTKGKYFKIEVNIKDDYLSQIIPLLAQSAFTDKAYISGKKDDLRLGQTNPFRVFVAVCGGVSDDIIERWYRMLNCMNKHSYHDAPELFYQIRYAYELTGYGQKYNLDVLNKLLGDFNLGARFLIYYNGSVIIVLSTAKILEDMVIKMKQGITKTQMIHGQITPEYALYAKIKLRMTSYNPVAFEFG